ncbi:MAG TPA: hypothetical protein VH640_01390 [Bryobacteraceae bacterium]|jgi:hypothetical protein
MRPAIGTSISDPLLAGASLPLSATYYPGGFPLCLTTNSQDVLSAAAESWGESESVFQCSPVQVRVHVQAEGSLSPQPSFRWQHHLLTAIADADNFAVADLDRLFGFVLVSAPTAADHQWLRWFFLESVVYSLLAQRYVVPVHAACVARNGRGILLCGCSGAGKSTLAWACARAGWTFISDDCTWLLPDSAVGDAVGRPGGARFRADVINFFPELEDLVERARPNGKLSLEAPLRAFPQIRTAERCPVRSLAFLERGGESRVKKVPACEAFHLLSRDRTTWGSPTDAVHERTFQSLASLPAYQVRYESLEDGQNLLARLAEETSEAVALI